MGIYSKTKAFDAAEYLDSEEAIAAYVSEIQDGGLMVTDDEEEAFIQVLIKDLAAINPSSDQLNLMIDDLWFRIAQGPYCSATMEAFAVAKRLKLNQLKEADAANKKKTQQRVALREFMRTGKIQPGQKGETPN